MPPNRRSVIVVVLVLAAFLIMGMIYYNIRSRVSWLQRSKLLQTQQLPPSSITDFNQTMDDEWLPVLRNGTIVSCVPFMSYDAYADKWLATFEDGRVAMLKLVSDPSMFERTIVTIPFDEERNRGSSRAEEAGKHQGLPELASFYVDRVLGLYRKPPITGRIVSNKMLWPSRFTGLIPSHDVAVTVHGWISGLVKRDPGFEISSFMTLSNRFDPSETMKPVMADISDTLLFDYLVDDHDRRAEKNWIAYAHDNRLILWDNGLGWDHGPIGFTGCLDILCGSNTWRNIHARISNSDQCQRICSFRKATVAKLRECNGADESRRLGYRLREAISDDHLAPLFHMGTYYRDGYENEIVRYPTEQFFQGMDIKVSRLLEHIDNCIVAFGAKRVLLDV